MSVYRAKSSPFYQYDFQVQGRRFHGSTKVKSKREAEGVERDLKQQARADIELEKRQGGGPLTLDIVAGQFWTDEGQHHVNSDTTWRNLERLVGYFGPQKRMDMITDEDVAALVRWRRGQRVKGRDKDKQGKAVPCVTPATVNRTTTLVLQRLSALPSGS